ncbi:MAG: RluA family pseudouridine synthase [Myxococcaceae bacterium]|nr:RluA family pseudouridine synthase [Myxococcaceae bacterium]
MKRSTVEASAADRGERVDRLLAHRLPHLSRSRLQQLIEQGFVTRGGTPVKASARSDGTERFEVVEPPPTPAVPTAEALPLTVLHEDRDVLVLDKAAGMVVHPGAGHQGGTLVNALLHHVADLQGVGGELRPGIVHRLDKDTSGVIVIAKNEQALTALQRAFAARDVEKIYLALVAGHPADAGTFRTLHGRHPVHRKRFSGRVKVGKPAVTHWVVQERLEGAALVEVSLETGRTHQIRVHFAEAGHPLLSDALYGTRSSLRLTQAPRLALHAHRLVFPHPRTGKRVTVTAPLPADLKAAVTALRKRRVR